MRLHSDFWTTRPSNLVIGGPPFAKSAPRVRSLGRSGGDLRRLLLAALWVMFCLGSSGCRTLTVEDRLSEIAAAPIPRELDKVSYPTYRVEPPDILLIEAVNNIRAPETPLRAGDELRIRASNTLPVDPTADPISNEFKIINDLYLIQPNGTIDLGPEYGAVQVAGLTFPEARTAIKNHLIETIGLKSPQVAVSMPNLGGKQVIQGSHLVRPDGAVSLGAYGSVHVAGMTLGSVKQTVEAHLQQFIQQPEVSVDVLAYNSKAFYVISDGGGFGETVIKLPCTGNQTVLDAISEVEGLSEVSSKKMWIARPAPAGADHAQVLPIDWRGITQDAVTTTNYQIFPGDRIYIKADKMVALENTVIKMTAPFERIMGFILLGNGTVRALQGDRGGVGTGF